MTAATEMTEIPQWEQDLLAEQYEKQQAAREAELAAREERVRLREERLARITAEAQSVRFGHTAALAITSLIVSIGWLSAKLLRVWLVAFAHGYASFKVGFNDGMGRGPTKEQLREQNRLMKQALERVGGDIPAMNYALRGAPR